MPDWKNLKDKAMAAVNNAADTVDRQITVTKLRSQVNQARASVDREYQQFGQTLYRKLQSADNVARTDPGVKDAWQRIAARKAALDQAEKTLQEAMASNDTDSIHTTATPLCSVCGAHLSASTKYCPECGHPV